jgi:P27 family predicted phage terminase small subunit
MWEKLLNEYQIDDSAGLSLLEAACSSYQRAEDARVIVRREGLTVKDRFGQWKAHPACAVERDARAQMISALRALKLSPEDA